MGLLRSLSELLLVAALSIAAGAAQAHPHVWITATSEVLYAPDGSVTGVRHAWTFDGTFSASAVQGLQGKTNGAYTHEELAPLAQAKVESLQEGAYFTSLKATGTFLTVDAKLSFAEPTDYFFDYKDDHLTLHFTLPLKTPVKSKSVLLEIYDRSFFIDFQMAKDQPVKLVGASADCKVWLQPSMGNDRDRRMVQDASEDSFKEGGANVAVGLLFDNKIAVDCP
ncbi:DUF1007 domain-containing protein [Bradyrhizobium guangdongense]|uniref:DUF1007 family protein n=1 Tax=Bradyrhizobium guangdongense TaxID=1325090 RepID=UPI00112DC720|nr:DUF1007 family protein [Bradyrhizobium guangdongense]TPQ26158.1 DUF1007 domain-containing protein [Bradyrhizobium guangdongense]